VDDGLELFAKLPPWMAAVADGDRVADALASAVPELGDGTRWLRGCEVDRVRLKGTAWTALYDLTVDGPAGGPAGGPPEVVRVRGTVLPAGAPEPDQAPDGPPLGADGWRAYLPELRLALEAEEGDPGLPALPRLTDPDQARALLEESIRTTPAYAGLRIRSSTPRVMRYKPGSRCTILYQLDYDDGAADPSWPDVVVAKTYHGEKGRIAWDGMRALWESPMATSGVAIAEPLAFLPDLNVLVQGPVGEEQTLKEALREGLRSDDPEAAQELRNQIAGTAAGLAALHTSGVQPGELVTWEDELAEVREVIDRLALSVPELAGAAEPMLARLEAVAAGCPADPAGPAHRSFRPAQVLLSKGRLGFIDFDGFCQAEPALDVALFRATVKSVGMTARGAEEAASASAEARLARGKELADLFLDRYEAHAPISRTRVALWEALDLFTMVLHGWTKAKPSRLGDAMFVLRDHLATIPAVTRI